MKEQLAAALSEGQVTKFVEDQEVEAAEEIGQPTLAIGAGFRVELVDQIDAVEEAAMDRASASAEQIARR